MININKKFLQNLRNTKLLKEPFRKFGELHGNIFKFSRNLAKREIKVPYEGLSYSIFYEKDDKLSDVSNRIIGTCEKLQKVEFLDFSLDTTKDENTLFTHVSHSPFRMRINGHILVKYIPSISMLIEDDPLKPHDGSRVYPETIQVIVGSTNLFLNGTDIKESHKLWMEKKQSIQSKLDTLLVQYEKLSNEYTKGEEYIDRRLKYHRILLCNIALIFFILHVFVFYWLIYQMYGWDTIEPITYIVGNVYWIIGLSFFVFKKKKLEFSFIFSSKYHKEFYNKIGARIGYCRNEKQFIQKEIHNIKKFKQILSKI